MDDLIAFLTARVYEDEAAARKATQGRWKLWGMEVRADPTADSRLETSLPVARTRDERGPLTYNAQHIARHDPARALREVEAKRAALAIYERVAERRYESALWEDRAWLMEEVLEAMLSAYCDHVEFREEWKVG